MSVSELWSYAVLTTLCTCTNVACAETSQVAMSSFSALQSSHVVRKINSSYSTAARLTETKHLLTAVRSMAKSSNASCNILYHLIIMTDPTYG